MVGEGQITDEVGVTLEELARLANELITIGFGEEFPDDDALVPRS